MCLSAKPFWPRIRQSHSSTKWTSISEEVFLRADWSRSWRWIKSGPKSRTCRLLNLDLSLQGRMSSLGAECDMGQDSSLGRPSRRAAWRDSAGRQQADCVVGGVQRCQLMLSTWEACLRRRCCCTITRWTTRGKVQAPSHRNTASLGLKMERQTCCMEDRSARQ